MTQYESEAEFYDAGGIAVKQIRCKHKGTRIYQHIHNYDHLSLLTNGAIELWIDGVHMRDVKAPQPMAIKAGVAHEFVTLEDDTIIYCVHNVSSEPIGYTPNPALEGMH